MSPDVSATLKNSQPSAPIGIFDSGVGGLTVARAVIDQLPQESVLYVGDTANGPYGPLPIAEVRANALGVMDELVDSGVKLLVIACNSASAAVLRDARERYTARYGIPVIEVIQPAVRRAVASTRSGRIGVIGTSATVGSRAYEDTFAAAPHLDVTSVACPRFVEYVEAGVVAGHLRPLAARKPVYGVLGNHDWWKDGGKVAASMQAAGITMVDNRSVPVRVRGCEFWLAGIGDLWEGDPDIAAAFAGIPDDGRPVIALTHNPDLFPRLPARTTLLVAGHTHGGQVTLPLLGSIVDPSKLGDRYARGHVEDGGEHVFVSPGLGTSILPVRFGIPPEVSRLTLLREASTGGHDRTP